MSNTFSLIALQNWSGLLCEADPMRANQSAELYKDRQDVRVVSALITSEGNNSLQSILQNNSISCDFEFLSIDVDGNDYHIWKSLGTHYNPRVVCIEFNPTIPNHIVFIQENNIVKQQGSSLLALVELGETLGTHGYSLVCTTTFNAIFVRNDLMKFLPNCDYSLSALHDSTMITDIFQTYDGELKLCGPKKLIWHKVAINTQNIQPLKKKMRVFPFAPLHHSDHETTTTTTTNVGSESSSSFKSTIDKLEECLVKMLQFDRIILENKERNLNEWLLLPTLESFHILLQEIRQISCDIIKSLPFEYSTSPLYEITIDSLLWSVIMISRMNYHFLLRCDEQNSNNSSITLLLQHSYQFIQQVSLIFQSIGNYFEVKKLNNQLMVQSFYQQSIYIYCFYDYYLHSAHRSNISIVLCIHQQIRSEICGLSNSIISLLKISKNKLDSNEPDQISERKVIWKLFEKGYWLWLIRVLQTPNISGDGVENLKVEQN